jgi:ATP-binding cassette subfamily B protein
MSTLSVIASVAVLVAREWRLAMFGAEGIAMCALGPRLLSRRASAGSHEVKARQSVLATMIHEDVAAQPVVKAFGLAPALEPRFRTATEKLRKASVRANFVSYLMERTPNIGLLFFNLLVIAIGSYLAFRGRLTIGSLVTFQALLMNLSASVYGITSMLSHFVQGTAGLQRIEELLADDAIVNDAPGAGPLPRLRNSIQYDHVSFGYRYGESLLQSLDLVVAAGTITAFVGASGSGKSTALNLLSRFYDPTAGAVRFDGHDARTITQESLRAQTGVVFQDSFLFNTTVRENIRYGRLGASDTEVEAAAELAEVHQAILDLPRGYDTMAGAGGSSLSGGQRQRIAIARALLRDPAVLLLDEATSALDPVTEAAVTTTLDRLRGDRTIVMVTHRLASARIADRIVVFAKGRVVETGTHAELLARDGAYRGLWDKRNDESLVTAEPGVY